MDISTVGFKFLWLYFIFGLGGLALGTSWFVDGASSLAQKMKISKLFVGAVVVSFATTVPELLVSLVAVAKHQEQMALGNIFGSFIANIGLVIGVSGLVRPIWVTDRLCQQQIPFLLGVLVLLMMLSLNTVMNGWGGLLLLMLCLSWCGWMLKQSHSPQSLSTQGSLLMALMKFFMGCFLMQLGSHLLVSSAEGLALAFNMSPYFVGVTFIAIGTTLPELATGIYCVLRGEYALMLGSIFGSNIFLMTLVLPLMMFNAKEPIVLANVWGDYWFMSISLILLWIFATYFDRQVKINRLEAALLLSVFLGYLFFLYGSV